MKEEQKSPFGPDDLINDAQMRRFTGGAISLLDQQAPGLEEGFTIGQEAEFIAGEWGIYSDMKGRASYLLKALVEEIRRLEKSQK